MFIPGLNEIDVLLAGNGKNIEARRKETAVLTERPEKTVYCENSRNSLREETLTRRREMAERLEDLNLPNAVVTRIIKEALPDGVTIGKDARTAVAKASSIFILYLTSSANIIAKKGNRKTISGQDVIQAMSEIEFDQFIDPLNESLENFRKAQKEKKDATTRKKQQKKDDDDTIEEEDSGREAMVF